MSKTYNNSITNKLINKICDGRLTLESGVAISTTSQAVKTVVYFTPYNGNTIGLYDGREWDLFSFSELSLSLSGCAANTNYDIFIYDNGGTLTLESTAWTDNTTRATSLTTQDGVYVKSGATTRRYLGTIRTTGTAGQCEDSWSRRLVWNYYNQIDRRLILNYNAVHSYTTSAWRPFNNNTTIGQTRMDFVIGLNLSVVEVKYWNESTNGWVGAAVDATNTSSYYTKGGSSGTTGATTAFSHNVSQGYHFVQTTQYGTAGSTFYGLYMQTLLLG